MKKSMLYSILALILLFSTSVYTIMFRSENVFKQKPIKIIIDAGHGLPDGGAVAPDGTIESDINLSISLKLNKYLTASGFKCILTRNGSESIYTEGETIHAKKVSDIRERIKIADNNPDAFFISIHMNTYPSSDVYGTQVFYKSSSNLSKEISEELQRLVNLKYQSENAKSTKPIPSNVYLFKNIKNDCILIECGFLTNTQDLQKFKSESFQSDIAKSIAEIITYKLSGSENNAT